MPANPAQLTRLTETETLAVRKLVDKYGAKSAAPLLGLYAEMTVWKVYAGAAVCQQTARTVRENLISGGESASAA